jgi:hypothetical protein
MVPTILLLPPKIDPSKANGAPNYLLLPAELSKRMAVITDRKGHFVIENLPRGGMVQLDQLDGRYAGLGSGEPIKLSNTPVSVCPPIYLSPASTIQGRVVRSGKPVAGLVVGAQSIVDMAWSEAVTDAQGGYKLARVRPGNYNVAMHLAETVNQEITSVARSGVKIVPGQHISGIDFDLIPGALIEGQVTRNGRGYETRIGIYGPAYPSSGAAVQSIRTNKNGHFRTRVPAGKQRVYVQGAPFGPVDRPSEEKQITVRDGDVAHVDLTAR